MSVLISATEKQKLIDETTARWEEVLSSLAEGGDITFGFLTLAKQDLLVAARTVDCQWCRKHVLEEVKLIDMTIELARMGNDYPHTHGIREKLKIAFSAVKITIYIALGGLRRAGLLP